MVIANKKGFRVARRDALLTFPDTSEYFGAEITAKLDVNVAMFLEFQGINDGASAEELRSAFLLFGDSVIIDWNLEDDDGDPVPPTGAGFMTLPPSFCTAVIGAWADSATTSGKG